MNAASLTNDFGPIAIYRAERFTITTFGLLVGFGFLLATLHLWFFLGYYHVAAHSLDYIKFGMVISLIGPLGAYLMSRLLDIRRWLNGEVTLLQHLKVPGFALWGGLLSSIPAIYLTAITLGWDPLIAFDGIALGLPLAQAFGRVGCLNYGCCHGRITERFFAIRYNNPETKVLRTYANLKDQPLHPTQIYSAIINLAIYATMIWLLFGMENRSPGLMSSFYLLSYGIKRFLMEWLRGEYPRTNIAGLTIWQWLSLGFAVAGLILLMSLGPAMPLVIAPSQASGFEAAKDCFTLTLMLAFIFTAIYSIHGRKIGSW